MCDFCMDKVDVTKCNCFWIDKILNSPLSWIFVICIAILVLCVFIFTLLAIIKLCSKCNYRSFLKQHLKHEVQNQELEKIIEESKKRVSDKIKPYVSKETTGSYQVNIDEVQKILDEEEIYFKKELKEKTDLHKLYLSRLADSFGD